MRRSIPFLIFPILLLGIPLLSFGSSPEFETRPKSEATASQRYQDTQRNVTVDAYVTEIGGEVLKTEFISHPPGAVQLKGVQLISPEGGVYGPKEMYNVTEQAARNLGRLRPIPVVRAPSRKTSAAKVSSLLLGTGLTALSGLSGSPKTSAYKAGEYGAHSAAKTSSGVSALGVVGRLAPAMLSQGGRSKGSASETVEWIEPQTAGTGLFSSIAEFDYPHGMTPADPLRLNAKMEYPDKSTATYTFVLHPGPFAAGGAPSPPPTNSIWEKIKLTGPSAKLL